MNEPTSDPYLRPPELANARLRELMDGGQLSAAAHDEIHPLPDAPVAGR